MERLMQSESPHRQPEGMHPHASSNLHVGCAALQCALRMSSVHVSFDAAGVHCVSFALEGQTRVGQRVCGMAMFMRGISRLLYAPSFDHTCEASV